MWIKTRAMLSIDLTVVTILLLLNFKAEATTAPIPLTGRLPGVVYRDGRLGAPVKLQAFLDLNCPFSARDWPVLKRVADHYGGEKLLLVINPFPLPYHRNGYVLSHGLYLTNDKKPSKVSDYMDAVFKDLNQLTPSATYDKNDAEVLRMLANISSKATGIKAMTYLREISSYEGHTRSGWKFAARRGVAGTPWYFVNDVDLCVDKSIILDFDGWKKLLDPLINKRQN